MRPVTTQQKPIYDRLNLLRRLLISHYIVIEAEYPLSVDPNFSKDDIYDNFTRVFSILKDCLSRFGAGFHSKYLGKSVEGRVLETSSARVNE